MQVIKLTNNRDGSVRNISTDKIQIVGVELLATYASNEVSVFDLSDETIAIIKVKINDNGKFMIVSLPLAVGNYTPTQMETVEGEFSVKNDYAEMIQVN